MFNRKRKEDLDKVLEENRFLRDRHRQDLERLKQLKTAAAEVSAASDILLSEFVRTYGTPVYDEFGNIAGYRAEIPRPMPTKDKLIIEPHEKIVGLDKHIMYRIGVVNLEEN